ncbi:MAG: DUF424 family protein [Candidatus Brockarchaeota archaeon]|nr:DUF424 family protein [Candidatus Brockarchaeota archaeon]
MNGEFYMKEHSVGSTKIIGACDRELLGKTIKDETGLEVNVAEKFYGGRLVDGQELLRSIRDASSVNLVGNRVVKTVLESGLGKVDNARKIGGVMFMMIIRI